jgi:two-component system, NarL family, response regulator LiaR
VYESDVTAAPTALVVDELALVRAGIAAVLHGHGIEVGAQTRSGRDALGLLATERPDLVVVGLPADLGVDEVVRRVVRLRPYPTIVALLPVGQDHLAGYLLALGAAAVVLRTSDADELGTAVDVAVKGGQHVAPALHGALAGRMRLPPLDDRTDEVLTAREREVLVLLAEGRSNREIANDLSVTLATVKSHLVRIYAKLEATNRNQALGRAVSLGLLR